MSERFQVQTNKRQFFKLIYITISWLKFIPSEHLDREREHRLDKSDGLGNLFMLGLYVLGPSLKTNKTKQTFYKPSTSQGQANATKPISPASPKGD